MLDYAGAGRDAEFSALSPRGEALIADLEAAAARFAAYLGASRCVIRGGVPREVSGALLAGARQVPA